MAEPDPKDRFTQLVAAVNAACDLPAQEADALLEARLGHSPALLAEAREILGGGRSPDRFLDRPPIDPAQVLAWVGHPEIPGYEIQEVLGVGGMGVVYRAAQANPERTVALKVLSTGLADPRARARFDDEIRALASLRHPGIAQVYAAGIQRPDDAPDTAGRPWFAMEFVPEAAPLVAYAVAQKLGTPARLRLLIKVLEAVHHGHQKGIVHRDLKPDNVLMDRHGRPKIIDYGIARGVHGQAVMATMQTHASKIEGTLPYMSPEHVSGASDGSDVRCDIYAVGVMLYQLLTDTLPVQVVSADLLTSMRRICEDVPRRPSQHRPGLPPDLDAIAMKGLAKNPAERYASADAFAQDLRRFLTHRPIEARVPGPWRQFRLFARRHRALVGASVVVLAVGAVATALSVNWALRADRSEQQAHTERAQAVLERSRAQGLFETLLERSIESTARVAPRIQRMQGGAAQAKEMMDAVLADVAVLEDLAQDDPRVRVLLAETWVRIGDTQGNRNVPNLGQAKAALASYRKAHAIATGLVAAHPGRSDARIVQVRSSIRIAHMLQQQAMRLRMRGKSDPEARTERRALLETAVRQARELEHRNGEQTVTAQLQCDALSSLGRIAIEERDLDAGLARADAIQALYDGQRLPPDELGHCLRAWSYFHAKRFGPAADAWAEVLALRAAAASRPEAVYLDHLKQAEGLMAHGEASALSGRVVTGLESLSAGVEILQRLNANDPGNRHVKLQLNIGLTQLGDLYLNHADEVSDPDVVRVRLNHARSAYAKALPHLGPEAGESSIAARLRARLMTKRDQITARLTDLDKPGGER